MKPEFAFVTERRVKHLSAGCSCVRLLPARPALPESSPAQPLPLQSNAPQAIDVPSVDATGDCDYWIVSSRNCDGRHAPCDAECCLSYFHCPADRSFCPQPRDAFLGSIRPDR